jgi:hypothetical protein
MSDDLQVVNQTCVFQFIINVAATYSIAQVSDTTGDAMKYYCW